MRCGIGEGKEGIRDRRHVRSIHRPVWVVGLHIPPGLDAASGKFLDLSRHVSGTATDSAW